MISVRKEFSSLKFTYCWSEICHGMSFWKKKSLYLCFICLWVKLERSEHPYLHLTSLEQDDFSEVRIFLLKLPLSLQYDHITQVFWWFQGEQNLVCLNSLIAEAKFVVECHYEKKSLYFCFICCWFKLERWEHPYLHLTSHEHHDISEVRIFLLTLPPSLQYDHITQLTFTCSKSAIETLDKGVKYVQS